MRNDEAVVNVDSGVELESVKLVHPVRRKGYKLIIGFLVTLLVAGGLASAITAAVLLRKDAQAPPKGKNVFEYLGAKCDYGYEIDDRSIPKVEVALYPDTTSEDIDFLVKDLDEEAGEEVTRRYNYIQTVEGRFTEKRIAKFFQDPKVERVEPNCILVAEQAYPVFNDIASGRQPIPVNVGMWGLDRMDSRTGRDGEFNFGRMTGEGVVVYVLDSGVRLDHIEFTDGRGGTRAEAGFSPMCDRANIIGRWPAACGSSAGQGGVIGHGTRQAPPATCSSHGTFCASLVAGQTLGVAKRATVVSVMVLDCNGRGANSNILAGLDWVLSNHRQRGRPPAIITFSMGTPSTGDTLNRMANAAVAQGITFFNSAGNTGQFECTRQLNNNPKTMTVGATTWRDQFAGFSNFGPCIQISAPGEAVRGANVGTTTASEVSGGTSYSTPYVAGIAAAMLALDTTQTPAQIMHRILCWATPDAIRTPGAGTPSIFSRVDVGKPAC